MPTDSINYIFDMREKKLYVMRNGLPTLEVDLGIEKVYSNRDFHDDNSEKIYLRGIKGPITTLATSEASALMNYVFRNWGPEIKEVVAV